MLSSHITKQQRSRKEPTNDKVLLDKQFLKNGYSDCYPLQKSLKYYFLHEDKLQIINIGNSTQLFLKNSKFQRKITQYINKMIEGVCYEIFGLSANEECQQCEAKVYASKNILQNIKQICLEIALMLRRRLKEQIIKEIKKQHFFFEIQEKCLQRLIKEKYQAQDAKQKIQIINGLSRQIAEFIWHQTNRIINELYIKYSSSPKDQSGEKIRKKIKQLNLKNDHKFDFLYLNQIFINKQKRQEEYASKIMEFINKATLIPYQSIGGEFIETYEQSFIKLNKKMIQIISQPKIAQKDIQQEKKQKQKKDQLEQIQQQSNEEIDEEIQEQAIIQESNNKLFIKSLKPKVLFSQNQIKQAQFQIKNAHQLRLIIKWILNIKEIFENSQQYFLRNQQNFKILCKNEKTGLYENKLIKLEETQRIILNNLIKDTYAKYNIQNNEHSSFFAVGCLIQQQEKNSNQSLKCPSLLNSYIKKEALKQLLLLFKISYEVTQKFKQQMLNDVNSRSLKNIQQIKCLNLISNKIDDLLSSKIQCNQSEFIKLLAYIYALNNQSQKDQKQNQNTPFFKLVKVKNMLESTNNVIINYMLYEKVQCKLQIFFQQSQKDKKIKRSIRNYLHDLLQGLYGTIPQLVCIINQNSQSSKNNQFFPLISQKNRNKESDNFGFQERIQTKSQKLQYVWRCINKNCEQYCFWGSFKFIKDNNKNYCLKCYLNLNTKQNIFCSLAKLQFSEPDKWVIDLLKKYVEQVRNIDLEDSSHQGLYLMLMPTEIKVIVQFILLFKQTQNKKWIIKSFAKNGRIQAKQFNQISNNDLYNRKYIFLRIDSEILKMYFQYIKLQKNLKYISKEYIQQLRQEALSQFECILLKRQLQSKPFQIQLNSSDHALQYFESQIKSNKLIFLKKLYAQSAKIKEISFYNQLQNLTSLHIKDNDISGEVTIQNYKHLVFIDLSYNRIQGISFINMRFLKKIILNGNKLKSFHCQGLKSLYILQVQDNQFAGYMSFQQKLKLRYLNISNNYNLDYIDLQNCPFLKKLNCSKKIRKIKSQIQEQKQINITSLQNIYLQKLEASNLSQQTLGQLKVNKLKSLKISLNILAINELKNRISYQSLQNLEITLIKVSQQQIFQMKTFQQFINNLHQNNLTSITIMDDYSIMEQLNFSYQSYLQQFTINSNSLISIGLNISRGINKLNIQAPNLKRYQINSLQNLNQLRLNTSLFKDLALRQMNNIQIIQLKDAFLDNNLIFQDLEGIRQISIKDRGQVSQCRVKNNLQLQKIQFEGFQINILQVDNCNKVQILNLNYQDKYTVMQKVYISLPILRQLKIKNCFIDELNFKISAKSIKKIQLDALIIKSQISFYDDETNTINLQYLYVSNYSLAGSQLNNLLKKINNIQRLLYKIKSKHQESQKFQQFLKCLEQQNKEIRLSKICKNVEQLILSLNFNDKIKIIVDVPIKLITFDNQKREIKTILQFQDSFFVNNYIEKTLNSKDEVKKDTKQFYLQNWKKNLKNLGKMNINTQFKSRIKLRKDEDLSKTKVVIRRLCLCQHIQVVSKYKGSLLNYAFTNDKTLKSIYIDNYQQSKADATFLCKNIPQITSIIIKDLNLKTLQISHCSNLQILHLQSVNQITMKHFNAELLNLNQIFITNISIVNFNIKISTKAIKKIGFINIMVKDFNIQFNEQKSSKMQLQLLEFSRQNVLPSQMIFQLFQKINSVQSFKYIISQNGQDLYSKSSLLKLDKFSSKIDTLYIQSKDVQKTMKIQLNNPVKTIELNIQAGQLQLLFAKSLSIRNTKKYTPIKQDLGFTFQTQEIQAEYYETTGVDRIGKNKKKVELQPQKGNKSDQLKISGSQTIKHTGQSSRSTNFTSSIRTVQYSSKSAFESSSLKVNQSNEGPEYGRKQE